MTQNIVDAIAAIIPAEEIKNASEGQIELHGRGGLKLGVMFDIKPDMSTDYTKFSCAPFVLDENGERKLGHWFNWPFDDMYMEVEPAHLQRLWSEINAYQVK